MKYVTKKIVLVCALAAVFSRLCAQSVDYSWDFSNVPIRDILYAVSLDTGVPITCDATVNGSGDFRFVGCDFETAFEAFLSSSRLYVEKSGAVWTVSRARVSLDDTGKIFADACDVLPSLFIEKISAATGAVITYTTLPAFPLTAHLAADSVAQLLSALSRQFAGYEVEESEDAFHIQQSTRTSSVQNFLASEGTANVTQEKDGTFSCDIKNAQFASVAEKLFELEEKPYCILAGGTNVISRAVFSGYSFEKTLQLICAQVSLDAVMSDGIYCVVAGQSNRNNIMNAGREWQTFSLSYTNTQDFLPIFSKRFSTIDVLPFPDKSKFICAVTENEAAQISEFIGSFDNARQTYLVKLKYAKTADFLAHLPPSVDASNLKDAGDGTSLFFTGTQEAYDELLLQLPMCDRPVERISYDILIMQYEDTKDNSWSSKLSVRRMQIGDRNGVAAQLGSVLSFNLDVVGIFGLAFAADMQAAISENRAHVFADTTVHGVSGRQINFQNTSTYRYRDNNINPETGKPLYTGITREISSGLKIDILGWVSGDGMITSQVTASMSRQGKDVSVLTGAPPPTTEKIITTEVRGRNCEPVILSGLIQNSESEVQTRAPLLSKIPIIGWLFKDRTKTIEKTEIVIYLVPHIEVNDVSVSHENVTAFDAIEKQIIDETFTDMLIGKVHEALFVKNKKNDEDNNGGNNVN